MYLNIEYRDGKTEQKIVDDCTVKDGCLKYYIRTGRDAGTHYIPLDIIKEFHKENQDFTERRQYMDFYNCPYVVVIPFRNGNEYDEDYGCEATGKNCQCCQCKLTPEECEQLIQKQKN